MTNRHNFTYKKLTEIETIKMLYGIWLLKFQAEDADGNVSNKYEVEVAVRP